MRVEGKAAGGKRRGSGDSSRSATPAGESIAWPRPTLRPISQATQACSESGALTKRRRSPLAKLRPEAAGEGRTLSRPPPSPEKARPRGQKSPICEPEVGDAAGWLRKASYLPRSVFLGQSLLRATPHISTIIVHGEPISTRTKVRGESCPGPYPGLHLGSRPWSRPGSRPGLRCIEGHRQSPSHTSPTFLARCAQVSPQLTRSLPIRERARRHSTSSEGCGFRQPFRLRPPVVKTCAHRAKSYRGRIFWPFLRSGPSRTDSACRTSRQTARRPQGGPARRAPYKSSSIRRAIVSA